MRTPTILTVHNLIDPKRSYVYHLRMRWVIISVEFLCVCLCVSVQAITFEPRELGTYSNIQMHLDHIQCQGYRVKVKVKCIKTHNANFYFYMLLFH